MKILLAQTVCTCLLLVAVGCGDKAANAASNNGAMPTMSAVWPESNSKVYDSFDMVVGLSGETVSGRIAVLLGSDPVPAGAAIDGDAQWFESGATSGEVTLPVGEHDVCVQLTDPDGKSMGPDAATMLHYSVVASPPVRRVFFVEPKDGATVAETFHVVFGVEGMAMSKANENVLDKTVGHHHLLVKLPAIDSAEVIPNDATHIHFGGAETEADVTLKPGTYELTMQFADGNHRSYGPRLASKPITITVE